MPGYGEFESAEIIETRDPVPVLEKATNKKTHRTLK